MNNFGMFTISFAAGACICFLMLTEVYPKKNTENLECTRALNSCIKDVKDKCSGVISYAIALEKENAKLNQYKKSCLEKLGK